MCFCLSGHAQNFQKTSHGIKTVTNGNTVEIQFYSPSIVRVIKFPAGKSYSKESLSVVLSPSQTTFTAKEDNKFILLKSDKLSITINPSSGDITFGSASGKQLLKEKPEGTKFVPFNDAGVNTYNVYLSFSLDKEEPIYGLGQHPSAILNQRNQK